jgi:hypothetical protein
MLRCSMRPCIRRRQGQQRPGQLQARERRHKMRRCTWCTRLPRCTSPAPTTLEMQAHTESSTAGGFQHYSMQESFLHFSLAYHCLHVYGEIPSRRRDMHTRAHAIIPSWSTTRIEVPAPLSQSNAKVDSSPSSFGEAHSASALFPGAYR